MKQESTEWRRYHHEWEWWDRTDKGTHCEVNVYDKDGAGKWYWYFIDHSSDVHAKPAPVPDEISTLEDAKAYAWMMYKMR